MNRDTKPDAVSNTKYGTKNIARLALLAAAALVLSYIESLLPLPIPVPGIKLGLSNTVLLYSLLLMSKKETVLLMLIKVLISGFTFTGISAMLYSLAGGTLSIAAMLLAKKLKGISVAGISISGAAMHNIGQCLVALCFIPYKAVLLYLPPLLLSAVITGALTGIIAKYILNHLSRRNRT